MMQEEEDEDEDLDVGEDEAEEPNFNLLRRPLDVDELAVNLPRRARQYIELLDQIPEIEPVNGGSGS